MSEGYSPVAQYSRHEDMVYCATCGAAVVDTMTHDRFHAALRQAVDAAADAFQALADS